MLAPPSLLPPLPSDSIGDDSPATVVAAARPLRPGAPSARSGRNGTAHLDLLEQALQVDATVFHSHTTTSRSTYLERDGRAAEALVLAGRAASPSPRGYSSRLDGAHSFVAKGRRTRENSDGVDDAREAYHRALRARPQYHPRPQGTRRARSPLAYVAVLSWPRLLQLVRVKVLAIESSCDDTAAAVLEDRRVLSSIVTSQDDVHRIYGGVVPELASRAHMTAIAPTIEIGARPRRVSASTRSRRWPRPTDQGWSARYWSASVLRSPSPSRAGCHSSVSTISRATYSPCSSRRQLIFPYVALLVSGGHTSLYMARRLGDYELLGATRDDAAGEAFDKVAKVLGMDYPGGRMIDELARDGDPTAHHFPRARLKERAGRRKLDFSFSGIKTAVALHVRADTAHAANESAAQTARADVAASFQEAVVDMLVRTSIAAVESVGARRLVVAGGVSANSRLRERLLSDTAAKGIDVTIPSLRYCTDNAAMIGLAACMRLERGQRDGLDLNARAVADLHELVTPSPDAGPDSHPETRQ